MMRPRIGALDGRDTVRRLALRESLPKPVGPLLSLLNLEPRLKIGLRGEVIGFEYQAA